MSRHSKTMIQIDKRKLEPPTDADKRTALRSGGSMLGCDTHINIPPDGMRREVISVCSNPYHIRSEEYSTKYEQIIQGTYLCSICSLLFEYEGVDGDSRSGNFRPPPTDPNEIRQLLESGNN